MRKGHEVPGERVSPEQMREWVRTFFGHDEPRREPERFDWRPFLSVASKEAAGAIVARGDFVEGGAS